MKRTPLKRTKGLRQKGSLRKTRLKMVSQERAKRQKKKFETYEQNDKEWNGCCMGCGRRVWPVNNSHLIPESVRKDLASDPRNITKHCQEKCHRLWEGNLKGVEKMLDYKKNIERLKELDYKYYLKFKSKHE